jgi:hypothetical protein
MLKYRQGDVGMEKLDSTPEGLEFKPVPNAILAEGEVTGHFHVLDAAPCKVGGASDGTEYPLEIAEKDGTMFLRVAEPMPLKHQEHGTITVEPGVYKVVRQREYAPEAPRMVLD